MQVVIIAAGYCTRAYRLKTGNTMVKPWPDPVHVCNIHSVKPGRSPKENAVAAPSIFAWLCSFTWLPLRWTKCLSKCVHVCGLQFFEVDLPQVSEKKISLVDAVIPDKAKVLMHALQPQSHLRGCHHMHTFWPATNLCTILTLGKSLAFSP